jgi:2-oxo-4-hydroxy-4-carboxy-5-ureidoimidazoline decarboxylase
MISLDTLNAASNVEFAAMLDGIFEYADWVAAATAHAKPFASVEALHNALMQTVRGVSREQQIAFLRGHPALSATAFAPPGLTAHSRDEQSALGLSALGPDAERFTKLAAEYNTKFGIPFIICARRHTPASVLRMLEKRVTGSLDTEIAAAIDEVHFITRLRLVAAVSGPGTPRTTGHLSTHVLDTGRGRPAKGVKVELLRDGVLIAAGMTDKDGRTAEALIEGEPLRIGSYELRFHVGPYFAGWSPPVSDPPWYDVIPVRMTVTEPEGHYHLPLLVAPWQYTTYRGS